MLASLRNPLLLLLLLAISQQPGTSAQAHALPGLANQQPLQQQPQQPQETSIPDSKIISHHTDPEKITMHTTLTLYTATQTITVPNTREAMQTSLSSFAEDAEEAEKDEIDECDPAQCAGCRAWYLCLADEGVEW
jgi:hypothetical protein